MVPTSTLAALGRLFRRHPAPSHQGIAAYAPVILAALDRAEQWYSEWFEQSALFADSERLANVAAIHRWEAATLGQGLERLAPPAALARAHADLVSAVQMASRAAQLLSGGSRFHNANAVCDGQTLLEESRRRRLLAARSLRRNLERYGPEPTLEAASTRSAWRL